MRSLWNNRFWATPLLGAAVLSILAVVPASAQTQFASFTQAGDLNLPFRFINTGNPATTKFGLYDASGAELTTVINGVTLTGVRVNFQFQGFNGLNATPNTNIDAILRFTTQVNGTTATSLDPFGGADTLIQRFQTVSLEFIQLDTSGMTEDDLLGGNLLTVTSTQSLTPINGDNPPNANTETNGDVGTTARLVGQVGTSTASFSATERVGGPNYVGYSSDFLNFNQTFSNRNFNLSFTNVQGGVARGSNPPGTPDSSDYFRSFTSSGAGTFGSDPAVFVPEPSSAALGLVALSALSLILRRKATH